MQGRQLSQMAKKLQFLREHKKMEHGNLMKVETKKEVLNT